MAPAAAVIRQDQRVCTPIGRKPGVLDGLDGFQDRLPPACCGST